MPRAALLSLHARLKSVTPTTWEHPSLVQLWGPRFNAYVVPSQDLAPFSLGRLPSDTKGRDRALNTAHRLHQFLSTNRMPADEAERAIGLGANRLRYAAASGRVVIRWDGSRQPAVWTVPPPEIDPHDARLELARRYLHVFGPATRESFRQWAGLGATDAAAAFRSLAPEITPVRTPLADAWILTQDEDAFRAGPTPAAPARLLPSGDAFYLAWDSDRTLLVPDPKRQTELWTSRVWPGALLVNGEITGVWRRSAAEVSIDPWRPLSPSERDAVEAEAASLPLPALNRPITVLWSSA